MQDRQDNRHQYSRENKSNSLVDVARAAKGINHHCQERSSRDKTPHNNHEKESKIDLAKQDLEDHAYKTLILQQPH
jgi:hypothetical protein